MSAATLGPSTSGCGAGSSVSHQCFRWFGQPAPRPLPAAVPTPGQVGPPLERGSGGQAGTPGFIFGFLATFLLPPQPGQAATNPREPFLLEFAIGTQRHWVVLLATSPFPHNLVCRPAAEESAFVLLSPLTPAHHFIHLCLQSVSRVARSPPSSQLVPCHLLPGQYSVFLMRSYMVKVIAICFYFLIKKTMLVFLCVYVWGCLPGSSGGCGSWKT